MIWVCPVCDGETNHPWVAADGIQWTCGRCAPKPALSMCGKLPFPSRAAAGIALERTAKQHDRGLEHRREERTYWCSWCSAWHLTSQPAVPA